MFEDLSDSQILDLYNEYIYYREIAKAPAKNKNHAFKQHLEETIKYSSEMLILLSTELKNRGVKFNEQK